MPKMKREKVDGKLKLSKDNSLEQAVAEIQAILVKDGKQLKNIVKAPK